MRKQVNILIPMAGAGSRFHQAGYSVPKPLIKVLDKTMIRTSIDTLRLQGIDCVYHFVARHYKEEALNVELVKELYSIAPDANVTKVDSLTEGSACTCLLAESKLDPELPLFIFNCDQVFNFSTKTLNTIYNLVNSDIDGAVITWKDTNPKNSFCEVSEDNLCFNFTEKQPVSDNALIGFHYWKKTSDFIRSAKLMIESKLKFNNEYYIAPTYNILVKEGKKIANIPIEKNECFLIGTPEDLNFYLNLPKIDTVLFDLDGVLVDTEKLHLAAVKEAVKEFGFCSDFLDYVPINLTTEDKIKCLALNFNKIGPILDYKKEIVKRKREIYDVILENTEFSDFKSKVEIFDYLDSINVNYYIVTNSSRSSVYDIFTKLDVWERLKHKFICADDCNSHKPNAEPYVRAIVKFNLNIDSTAVIEDSEEGYLSATSAGLRCKKINNPSQVNIKLIDNLITSSRNLYKY